MKPGPVSPAEPFTVDPDKLDKATAAHAATQNELAEAVAARGLSPRRPSGEPNFDLAWEDGGVTFVAEVKSITAVNEEKQLRLALGQVLRYRQILRVHGYSTRAIIAVSAPITDPRWRDLCEELGIGLIARPGLAAELDDWV